MCGKEMEQVMKAREHDVSEVTYEAMAASYQVMENGIVGAYKKIEDSVVSGYKKMETAMFAQFGAEMSPQNQRIFIILTGAGVSMIVVTLSVLLIVNATKEIGRNQDGK